VSRFSRELTYYDPGEAREREAWEPQAADVHTLRHGYNLADLDVLTRSALSRGWARNVDRRLRYDIAWSGVAEALYAATERPEPAGEVFNFLARGLAVLACQPGGVTFSGQHWCVHSHPRCPVSPAQSPECACPPPVWRVNGCRQAIDGKCASP
jgi:hypothetical protein